MVSKFGLLINSFGFAQQSFQFTSALNQIMSNGEQIYPCVFFENVNLIPYRCLFPVMNIIEAFEFDGTLMATSLSNACKMMNFPFAKNKYFYIWDLEWIRLPNKNFQILSEIYRHPSFQIVARSQEHADIINECWNVKVKHILDDFNPKQLLNMI